MLSLRAIVPEQLHPPGGLVITNPIEARLDTRTRGANVLVVGVGGQGVLMISRVLALMGQRQGFEVKQSEVHGMAKRGGIVFSHIRFAPHVWSPTISKGEADVLVALEWAEGLRWLEFLKPETGVFIADTRQIVPPFACRNRKPGASIAYAKERPDEIVDKLTNCCALDATTIATELGDARAANTVLLGALSVSFDYPIEDWREILDANVPKGTREINAKAFEAGRQWAMTAHVEDAAQVASKAASLSRTLAPAAAVELEITRAWCKGCDICVKLCPERCLALDSERIAVLTNPDACTGCHVCEWLCPDFAIRIHHSSGVASHP